MELRHLLALEKVLSTGSFTAAAAARHVSQPALWAQIKDLEAELGLRLFVRSGRRVVPTHACLALRPRLEAALASVAGFRGLAAEVRAGHAAPARIGCAPSHVAHFLAGCIRELVDADAHAPLPVVVPTTTRTAIDALASGEIDLLVEPRDKRIGPHAAPLYPMHVVAVGNAVTDTARGPLDLRALHGTPIATLPPDSLVQRMLVQAANAMRISLQIVHESRDRDALLALAREGLCTAVVHDEMLDERQRRTAAHVVARRRPLSSTLWLEWHREDALSPAAVALRDVMLRRARRR